MNNVMIDIETLGTESYSVILSIGACYFDPKTSEIGKTMHVHIDAKSCTQSGLKMDPDTVIWWLSQENEAQNKITQGQSEAVNIIDALNELTAFVGSNCKVWGNGSTFDNALITNAYTACSLTPPWKFWNDRDVRTIVELGQQLGFDPKRDMPFEGTKHDALSDAIHQAKYVSAIWQRLIK